MKTPITKGEVLAIALPIICLLVLGAAFGWFACAGSARYQYLLAATERYEAERTYYERQACAIIEEGIGTLADKNAPARRHDTGRRR